MKKLLIIILIASILVPVMAETSRGYKFFLRSGPTKEIAYSNAYNSAVRYMYSNNHSSVEVIKASYNETEGVWNCNLFVNFK
ncbi:hypothetical protein KAJ27_16960 [bacterium]|nr:hypothetical protein [bacterium]